MFAILIIDIGWGMGSDCTQLVINYSTNSKLMKMIFFCIFCLFYLTDFGMERISGNGNYNNSNASSLLMDFFTIFRALFQKPFGSTANPIAPAIAAPSETPPPQRHRTAAARAAVEEYTLP